MLFAVAIIVTAAVVFAVGALTVERLDRMSQAVPDGPAPQALPSHALSPGDVRSARFGLALRGYRMAEVDVMLSRLAEELAWRDEELARRDDELVKLAEFARVDHPAGPQDDRNGPVGHPGAGAPAASDPGEWSNT